MVGVVERGLVVVGVAVVGMVLVMSGVSVVVVVSVVVSVTVLFCLAFPIKKIITIAATSPKMMRSAFVVICNKYILLHKERKFCRKTDCDFT